MAGKTKGAGARITLPCGHNYTCATCRHSVSAQERRQQGLPSWVVNRLTPEGYLQSLRRREEFRKRHLARYAQYKAGDRARQKEKYGGDPSTQWHARLKWLEERMIKRKKRPKQRGASMRTKK